MRITLGLSLSNADANDKTLELYILIQVTQDMESATQRPLSYCCPFSHRVGLLVEQGAVPNNDGSR